MKIIIPILFIALLFSCTKEKFTTRKEALLQTSIDTLMFDTVFTATGSVTQSFKIINNNDKGIHISAVKLGSGVTSPFHINVGGQTGTSSTALDIDANDSAYVFVTVHINPTNTNLSFVVQDSVIIEYNNNKAVVQLKAYGQNAHFFKNKMITGSETWSNDKPYVILDGLTIAPDAQLTITKGCKIYMHANAPVVVNGTLEVTGEKGDSSKVIFTGDRLDDPYRDFPAGWPGIYFSSTSKNNTIQYAVIKNAYQAIVLQKTTSGNANLTMGQTIIDNAYDAGIIADNSSITAQNLLISNCGKNIILQGGNYIFTHCTVASYTNLFIQHKDPVLYISNFTATGPAAVTATFRNCIFWGDDGLIDNEVTTETQAGAAFNVTFDHILWKQKNAPANLTAANAIINEPPLFDSINTTKNFYSFKLKEASPAINKGVLTSVNTDIEGKRRPVGLPDLGCYEMQ